MDTFGKILTSVLNNHLQRFAKLFEKIPESQAGFRQGYCTADNIFTLHCLVQKYLSKDRGRFYCIFVDFKKAFESINRKLRWYSIMNKGIHGRLFVVIENMYYKVKAAVRISNTSISSYFDCMSGVRQGCVLSPFLFAMFISELQNMLEDAELRGIFVGQEFQDLLLLLYADDLCIFDDTVIGLQKKIDILNKFCIAWGLHVNMDKTEILVFTNGGILRTYEKWYMNGKQLKMSTCYNVLGVLFSTRLPWTKCTGNLASKASKALFVVTKLQYTFSSISVTVLFQHFDSKIKPILLYGAEV